MPFMSIVFGPHVTPGCITRSGGFMAASGGAYTHIVPSVDSIVGGVQVTAVLPHPAAQTLSPAAAMKNLIRSSFSF
jgi:hypothetical protein